MTVLHDLLENGSVLRRIYRGRQEVERVETPLEHGCLSCTVRLDVVPTVHRLLQDGAAELVVSLPPSVPADLVVEQFRHSADPAPHIDSIITACSPAGLEDQLWDTHTLFESGYTPTPGDDRTPGEFLIGELAYCDTVHCSDLVLAPAAPDAHSRGTRLVREIAPHAAVVVPGKTGPLAGFDLREARARSRAGSVRIPAASSNAPFRTAVLRAARPLHPGRFRLALGELAAGNCWLRGRVWLASAPTARIALRGYGPRVILEDTGPWVADAPNPARAADPGSDAALDWHAEHGDRGTVLAVTGDSVDEAVAAGLLAGCELTAADLAAGVGHLPDPFGLSAAH
ncbi:GTPase, G3E family protein [Arthrobacter crystallopoietes BAB-32]|uniref:GTPase, G3E family protein n=2 Tax=Crystallibacter crystallopoietes TaxID=37928 RepID=N1VA00_9MICC|nr:GTPase, G3E family protein [Arthrobacter crystallopoietes BAB-32]